jgi:hypothetical protein
MNLGKIEAPELRSFEVRTGGLTLDNIKSVTSAKWPSLERLVLWFGDEGYGAQGGLEDIEPLLSGKGLGKLKHLGLQNADFTDELCGVLHKAKILPQLESLDLSMGTMSHAGAEALAAHAQAFAHLKQLNVEDNYLTAASNQILKAVSKGLNFGRHRDADDGESRYVSVGE